MTKEVFLAERVDIGRKYFDRGSERIILFFIFCFEIYINFLEIKNNNFHLQLV